MIIEKTQVKRLGVFFFYDKDGVADRYVDYLISEYSKCQDKLVIVSNGEVQDETKNMFLSYTDDVIIRENKGLDVGAYLAAFQYVGWDELESYDEVTIANFTLMGPVYPLSEMYQRMENADVDFWGISKHFKFEHDFFGNIPYGYLPEHIQSHYMVFRSSLVKSKEFQEFWDNMPQIRDYKDSVALFEATFTKKFEDYGFRWDICVSVEDMKGITLNPIMEYPVELMRNRKCPFFKRRSFFQEHHIVLDTTLSEPTLDLYYYIDKETAYDTSMIWENLMRTCNHADFAKTLHLDFVLDSETILERTEDAEVRAALVMHLEQEDLIDCSIHYASSVPKYVDIILVVKSEHSMFFKEQFQTTLKNRIKVLECETSSDVECFIMVSSWVQMYDIFCYYHDRKGNVVANSFFYKNAESVLRNKVYVRNVIKTFCDNEHVGMLVPLEPNHADYFPTLGREWNGYYDDVLESMKQLQIMVSIAPDKEPIAPLGMMAWFRTKAVVGDMDKINLIKDKYDKERFEHIFKRLLSFVCLNNQFYPAYVVSEYGARIELTNTRYYLREYGKMMDRLGIVEGTQKAMIRELEAKQHGVSVRFETPRYMRFAAKMQRLLPQTLYNKLIYIKRKIFGPYDLV